MGWKYGVRKKKDMREIGEEREGWGRQRSMVNTYDAKLPSFFFAYKICASYEGYARANLQEFGKCSHHAVK